MLKVTCFSSLKASQYVYAEELVDFSWYVKVNESASLIASIPTVVATLKIAKVDEGLRAIRKDDRIRVQNTSGTGLVLLLRVTEVTIFERRKEVEIACTYVSFGQVFDGIEGVIEVPKNGISDWISGRVKTWNGTLDNDSFLARVKSKDDLILALSWSYASRRNISLLPFSTRVTAWNGTDEAVAMFPDQRHNGTEDGTVPIYVVEPEDIVEYEITPADPPVTYLRSASLGRLKLMPQIPVQEVHSIGGTLTTNVRTFYSGDLALGMVYTAKTDNEGVIDYQRLQWTDGIVVESNSSARTNVIGMFSNAYIESSEGSTRVVDRVSGSVLASYAEDISWYVWSEWMGFPVCNTSVIENDSVFVEVAWMCRVIASGSVVAVAKKTSKTTGIVTYEAISASDARVRQYTDLDATYMCEVSSLPDNTAAAAFGVYNTGTYELDVVFISLELSGSSLVVGYSGVSIDVSQYMDNGLTVEVANADCRASDSRLREVNMVFSVFVLRINTGDVYRKAIHYVYAEHGSVVSSQTLMNGDMAVFTAPGLLVIDKDNDIWKLCKGVTTPIVIQSGSISSWAGVDNMDDVNFAIDRGMVFTVVNTKQTAGTVYIYNAYMQLQELSFISRDYSEQYRKVKIAEGQENALDLSFQVGAIDPSKVYIDKEIGRIEVKLSKFYVFDIGELDYIEKDIQYLENMATGAYVKIGLTPDDASDFVIAKVVGFKLTYSGVVEAKLYGIIVE